MKSTPVRALAAPALALALVGGAAPAAQAAPAAPPAAATTVAQAPSTAAATLTIAVPRTSTVEEAVTRSGARRMRTTATWFPSDGRVVATTRTWNSVKLTGFTGGVQVVFLDRRGHVLGATGVRTFGVDGTLVGRYNRTDVWEERVAAPWMAQATSIRVVHTHAGKNRLADIVRKASETTMQVAELIARLNSLRPAS
jgi:hypothetical protein